MLELDPGLVIAGTGHRPDKIGAQEKGIRAEIRSRLNVYRPAAIISGMALGFDQWWADEAMQLGIKVVAAIPFFGQESRWPAPDQLRYHTLLTKCAVVEMLQTKRPTNHAQAAMWMYERNAWMVDKSHAVVACYNGDPDGGTCHCVRYARVRKKPLDVFDPYTLPVVLA